MEINRRFKKIRRGQQQIYERLVGVNRTTVRCASEVTQKKEEEEKTPKSVSYIKKKYIFPNSSRSAFASLPNWP